MSLKPRNVDFQETWQNLKETVAGVVGLRRIERGVWNNRFSDVYALCVAYPEPLADKLYDETKAFLEEHVAGLLERVKGPQPLTLAPHDDAMLNRYYEAWSEYSQGVAYLNSLYSYLNLQHIKRQKVSEAEIIYGASAASADAYTDICKLEVGELGLVTWERVLVRPLAQALCARILHALAAAREHAARPSTTLHERTLRAVIHSFIEAQAFRARAPLALYCELVETPHLEVAAAQHASRAAALLQRNDVSRYMEDVLQGLEGEMALSARLLHASSLERCRACYEQCTVGAHLPALHAECERLVRAERRGDLANMYRLLRPLPGALKPLVDAAHKHMKEEGVAALAALDNSEHAHVHFVETMLAIHHKYKTLFAEVFNSDQAFVGALDKACSAVINTRPAPEQPCRSPELLARYCDALLRKRVGGERGATGGGGSAGAGGGGALACSEQEAEERLAAAIVVFKYVDDKDVFQKYYARALAKRLIHQLSASMDQEEAMINRLKQACGYEFTNKLHRMFTDVAVSADLNGKFHEYLRESGTELGITVSIQVLQAGAWPLGGACAPLAPPPQLERVARLFEQFYRAHFSGRRLAWLHHLCAGELRTRYTKRPYHLAASTPQCALLLCFDNQDVITASELRASLQLPAEAFVRHARGLVEAQLLTVEGGDIETEEESCSLRLNLTFQSKRTRVRVTCAAGGAGGSAAGGAGGGEPGDAPAQVDDDRKMYLQAALVRIMKARKVLRHNELIQEVVAQARSSFAPSVAMIKKCIEALIDKQYLERAPGHSDQYSYVA